jgi:hypothetical protein
MMPPTEGFGPVSRSLHGGKLYLDFSFSLIISKLPTISTYLIIFASHTDRCPLISEGPETFGRTELFVRDESCGHGI